MAPAQARAKRPAFLQRANFIPASRPIPHLRTTRDSGPHCNPSAAVAGADACTTRMPFCVFCKQAKPRSGQRSRYHRDPHFPHREILGAFFEYV